MIEAVAARLAERAAATDRSARRLAREAMSYALTQLTPELKRATLERLACGSSA